MLSSTIVLCVLASSAAQATPLSPGEYRRSLTIAETNRTYRVYVPRGYDATRPTPVVLVFHGAASNARQMMHFTGLNAKADEAGFLAVYPNGTGLVPTWNAGSCCGPAQRNGVDDVAFVSSVLDDLALVAAIDPKRVFATGISNGGMFCYRLASELSGRIAAIAPVAGGMSQAECHPQRPVSVLHFHGTSDDFVPYAGGRGTKTFGLRFQSVEQSVAAWRRADGCPDLPTVTELPDKTDDGSTVTRTTYPPGKDGAEVVLFTIKGGGHTWPGGNLNIGFLGTTNEDISANDLMWAFFQKHPMH